MDLDELRIDQLSSEGWQWYQAYLTALDAYDVDAYVASGRRRRPTGGTTAR